MFGYSTIQLATPITMDEFEEAIKQHWDPAWGPFYRGKPTPLAVGEYMVFPLSSAYCVIAHPKKDTIKLNAAALPEGAIHELSSVYGLFTLSPEHGTVNSQSKANKLTPVISDRVAAALAAYQA